MPLKEEGKIFMVVCEELIARRAKLSLTGLGYVGLPIAIEFGKQVDVIGYDYNNEKIATYSGETRSHS